MKKNNTLILGILIMIPLFSLGQSSQDRAKIASFSDQKSNKELLKKLNSEEAVRRIRLSNYLHQNPTELTKMKMSDGFGIKELVDISPNGEKIYAETHNYGASITARANQLYSGGSLNLNIQGQNMIAGVWDGGNARNTHQEFTVNGTSKITLADGASFADHATHVTGTICAQGISQLVRGLAFNSSVISYDWTSDLTEMLTEASNGLLLSNHSYGMGQLGSIWFYGAYDNRARQIDNITFNNPYYLPVFSAGNDRNETTAPGSTQISNKGGYDMIFGHGNAKNVITVAAVGQVSSYTGPSSVPMSSFSSWGPSDDGRIKPDISMKGVSVRSTLSTSDTSTGIMSGTSMASPGITGVGLLLQQYYNQLNNGYMRAATLKGLILHTADEAGDFDGPDYSFGWGLVNAEKAANTIKNKNNTSGNKSIIEELTLNNGSTITRTIVANGSSPLKVSISWTDPQYPTANNGTTDPGTKYLVNDLDIKVTKDNSIYYPWKLQGMSLPYESATNTSTNDVDNFERVDIANPSGTYTITITHKNTLSGGNQKFSLIATSDNLSTLSSNEISLLQKNSEIYPNPTKDFIYLNNFEPNLKIEIYDMAGRILLKETMKNNYINVSNLTNGNYIIKSFDKNGNIKNFKFIKE